MSLSAIVATACWSASSPNRLPPDLPQSNVYLQQADADSAIDGHVSQQDIVRGIWTAESLIEAGRRLFVAQFTVADGAGRPGATGDPNPTRRPLGSGSSFTRTSGPDANSCVACHSMPVVGGAGSFSSNVFAGQGSVHPQLFSTNPSMVAERGSPEMQGAGLVELVAREMTAELHGIRDQVRSTALERGRIVELPLVTKGVSFGVIAAGKTGTLDLRKVQGVDRDLVVRPWGQKGSVTSLRTFTVTAANLHHGMQATERFGRHLTGTSDFDRDGISDELTEGDITALVVFQATLPMPGRVLPRDQLKMERVALGERLFAESKCSSCHIPHLPLNDAIFTEPGPYNLEGTMRKKDVVRPFEVNLLTIGMAPRPTPGTANDPVKVRLFSDLKRHVISDSERPHFGNEVLVEGLIPTDQFITRRLWAVGNTGPYGHRGDLSTIREAIHHHGGEARDARLEFERSSKAYQDAIVDFLRSMQVLPEKSPPIVFEQAKSILPYR